MEPHIWIFQMNLKHVPNRHNSIGFIFFGHPTDELSEEYGLVSEGNGVA